MISTNFYKYQLPVDFMAIDLRQNYLPNKITIVLDHICRV